jgi:uncharacterized delta-60 repeat protein
MKLACLLPLLAAAFVGLLPSPAIAQVDTVTETPTLSQVTSVMYQGGLMTVSFTLPESAAPGSVVLSFAPAGMGAPQTFTLIDTFETAGAHTFAFNPDDPGPSSLFLGSPLPLSDGIYTVTLSYDDVPENGVVTSAGINGVSISSIPGPGTVEAWDAQVDGYVYAIAVQADGGTILAGNFTSVLGAARKNIARLKADGTLDPGFDPQANNGINSVAMQTDGKVLIAGYFTEVQAHGAAAPVTRQSIARLNADGTLDESFDPAADSYIYSLAIQPDGKILLGGDFTSLQPNGASASTPRGRIARVNADGTLDDTFDPNANGTVASLALQPDGRILLGGAFATLQPNGAATPTARMRLARVNADGTLDSNFSPQADDAVNCIALQPDGKVLIGGEFANVQGSSAGAPAQRGHLARLNPDGTLDQGFDPTANQTLFSIALQADGKVLIAGSFNSLAPNGGAAITRHAIARLNTDGTVDPDFDPSANDSVYAITLQAGGKILIGGEFTELQPANDPTPTPRTYFAQLKNDPATLTLSATSTTQAEWLRGGAAPEVSNVTFEQSPNGTQWFPLGTAGRMSGGWKLSALNLAGTRGTLRARARTIGGINNGSPGLVEQTAAFDFDTTGGFTVTPTLTAPASSTIATSSTTVSFTLPEPAKAGSVKLIFGGTATLTLASSFETTGLHSFTFNPADPVNTSSGAVVSILSGPITEGAQNIQLSYRDTLDHNPATATSTNVTVDTLTKTPELYKPEQDSLTHLGVQVDFKLGEAAAPGSVKLTFKQGADTVAVFTLATAQESADPAPFTFNPQNPTDATAGGAIAATTGPMPDGTYSVTLSYRDANDNAVASTTHTNVKLDNVAPAIDESTIFVPLDDLGAALMPDLAGRATDPNGISAFTQDPTKDTPLAFGEFLATVNATDGAGNSSTGHILVIAGYARPNHPTAERLATTNDPVPIADTFGVAAPADIKLATLGTPAISDNRFMIAKGTFAQGTKKLACLYETSPTGSGLVAFQGSPASGINNAVFKSFRDPVISPSGTTVAFAGKVSGGGTKTTNDDGVWRVSFNPNGSATELLLREGDDVPSLPAGVKLKAVLGLSVQNDGVLALVQLMPKPPLVKATNDTALIFLTDAQNASLLVRKGDPFPDSNNPETTVKTFSTLAPALASPGHGRWHTNGLVAARLTLADKRVALVQFANATSRDVVALTGDSSGLSDNSKWLSFGLPAQCGAAEEIIATGTLKPQAGAVTKTNDTAIGSYWNGTFTALQREGDNEPITGKKWASFFAPVMNDFGLSAFLATLKGTGITPANGTALYWGDAVNPALLARLNDATVPDKTGTFVTGRKWTAITSYALPYGSESRIVFVAKVKGAGVTPKSTVGLYAVDTVGTLREMLRTDDPIDVGGTPPSTKKVKTFTVLNATAGAYGVARSYNTSGSIAVLVTFADKTQTILRLDIP